MKWLDWVIIAAALAAAAGSFFLTRSTIAQARFVEIDANETHYRYDLSVPRVEHIRGAHGMMTVVIQSNSARVSEADCPEQICVRQGAISKPGESIICVPNKTVITITGGDSQDGADAICQ